ncbi:hypothetical protein KI387_036834, partial [Taxus chinensis]
IQMDPQKQKEATKASSSKSAQISTREAPCKTPPEVVRSPPLVGQASVSAKVPTSVPKQKKRDDFVPQMHKLVGLLFSIVDQMNKTNINVTMWDAMIIPSQSDLLHEALAQLPQADPVVQKFHASINICQEEEKKLSK